MENFTLITGATGGLGKAFSEKCAKRGDNLVISGTKQERLDELKKEINTKYPEIKIVAMACDLSDENERVKFFDAVKKQKININFLINNAGLIVEGDFINMSDEDALKVIKVNCEGTIDFTQKVIKARDDRMPLHIITVASLAGYYPMPHMAMYAATKAMLKSFMVALALEMKDKNVFITTVCPSGIYTSDAMKEAIKAQGFNGKITANTPEQVAEFALKASKKHKIIVVPKAVNRFVKFISKFPSEKSLAKTTGRMWKKSQDKRNIK